MIARYRILLAISAVCVVAFGPLGYAYHHNTHLRNFRVVEEGVLYRSGQNTPDGLEPSRDGTENSHARHVAHDPRHR